MSEQLEFKELMFMARNEFAMPLIEGCKREIAVNTARMNSKKVAYMSPLYKMLFRRNVYLSRLIRQREG